MKRKDFIRTVFGATIAASLPSTLAANEPAALLETLKNTARPTQGNMVGFADTKIELAKIGIIGLGNRGTSLTKMLQINLQQKQAVVEAFCDLDAPKVAKNSKQVLDWQSTKPKAFVGKGAWEKMLREADLDLVIICTPWEWHAKMALAAMEAGIHVASEVPIAYTMEENWQLVQTAEKTKKHCIMLENCCYGTDELWILQMIENGIFGTIKHVEGAYLHDLRKHMFSDTYYKDYWRLKHHQNRDGNFYTTHGLGPDSFYLKIGRGDWFDKVVSMSSIEHNLTQEAARQGKEMSFTCGDINNTLIKTKLGKTILLQFDVHTGRPYSRINKVVGSKAVHDGYPSRLYIDSKEPTFSGHKWLKKAALEEMKSKYEHPLLAKLREARKQIIGGHGGMDFVMMYRLIRCLNLGIPLDINVYDSVAWSAVTPISEISVASGSMPIPFPDFMNGAWKEQQSLEIMRSIS